MSKVILITGGSSGIGKSTGEFLVKKGYKVYGTSRNPEKLIEFDIFPLLKLDVSNPASITAAVEEILKKEGRIDVLVNNAGVGITGPIEETPHEEILKAFNTNFNGPLNVIKAVLPHMRTQNSGLVINITSIAAYMGLPYRGIYSATKAALEVTTEALRMETKDFGVKFTNVAPGDFATNIASGRYHAPVLNDSPYKLPYGKTLEMMNEHVDGGDDPQMVAGLIYRIINTKNPKIHYKVGAFMQKFSIVLKRILPDKAYERLLLNHYKL
ncbi:SDR family oxidoreductase [Abyssalbus ytuae]|uniref:SDR family oxidoreductase n=1 Tax=Abyssalbus ytuae TaxID=2926907 RepID=A0A9E6ZMH8_9FLAO|nr:SDR family oxidoreductase [Abyssalbus ytuae]UOB16950.1 SDR family oxidoreductase [Abyssalbus ytuae]